MPREDVLRLAPRPATLDELATVHEPRVHREGAPRRRAADRGGRRGRPPRASSPPKSTSRRAATTPRTLAAGAPLVALDAIGEGRARNGYALVRPPGHHARPSQAMGFCIFNNVAVAARYAQQRWGWQRVLIVDYDVHHGNGTAGDVLRRSRRRLLLDAPVPLVSWHRRSTEMGEGAGLGATINVPLPAGSGWSVYDPIFRQVLWPVADRFKPDVILLSAGFDAHWRDPLGEMRLCTADLLRPDAGGASRSRIATVTGGSSSVQEGGYNLDAMAAVRRDGARRADRQRQHRGRPGPAAADGLRAGTTRPSSRRSTSCTASPATGAKPAASRFGPTTSPPTPDRRHTRRATSARLLGLFRVVVRRVRVEIPRRRNAGYIPRPGRFAVAIGGLQPASRLVRLPLMPARL